MDEMLVNQVRQIFGLNLYEARIWLALLGKGIATAGELSDIANVPRSRVYDVLESLEKKGFIVMKIGKPITYIAIPPDQVLENVKRKIVDDALAKAKKLEEMRDSELMETLREMYEKGTSVIDPSENMASIRGRRNILSYIANLIKNAKKEIIISTTDKGLIRKIEALRDILIDAKNKGVEIKIVAPVTEENKKFVEELKGVVKVINKSSKARFVVVDGSDVIMFTSGEQTHPNYEVGVWIRSPNLAESLKDLLESK